MMAQGFSPLKQITAANIGKAVHSLGLSTRTWWEAHETTPIVNHGRDVCHHTSK